ncbi:MAG: 16S rRNA (adenine(1518)-N(6)/adenine(1519)-N(6))-dimethyltransferase RsmA [bacterium]|nr:16S rRNA (adenine(1518)-N(6)/adenine(1519)-N(6))-dimethyltransferase RsmA [bacterium]
MSTKLGQHFLKNDSAIKKIIAALDIQPGETIIEIGPGKGALTFPLLEECAQKKCRLIAIEKDAVLAQNLESKIMPLPRALCHSALDAESRIMDPRVSLHSPEDDNRNIKIITGDALEILTDLTNDKRLIINSYKIVGNIPYYITGKLLRTISELKNKPKLSVLMVQKEVAERICATTPKMNLLAAATQYWASPKIILNLKAKEFDPPPEVDSAVIKIATRTLATSELEAEKYYKLIHIIFKQPRKTLANNLKDGLEISREETEKILNTLGLPLNSRPQDVSVEQILKISGLTSF